MSSNALREVIVFYFLFSIKDFADFIESFLLEICDSVCISQ